MYRFVARIRSDLFNEKTPSVFRPMAFGPTCQGRPQLQRRRPPRPARAMPGPDQMRWRHRR